jgi:hypothetical protein
MMADADDDAARAASSFEAEKGADQKLSSIAEGAVNMAVADEEEDEEEPPVRARARSTSQTLSPIAAGWQPRP